jgi:hypothetical protein
MEQMIECLLVEIRGMRELVETDHEKIKVNQEERGASEEGMGAV